LIEKIKKIKEIINYIKKQNMIIEGIKKTKVIKQLITKKSERDKIDKNCKFDYIHNWTDLIQSDQKMNKIENQMLYFNDYFIRNPI
jgi:hypothetical protein